MPDTRYLPVLEAIHKSEDATRTAILASWPDASDIVYRRVLDENRDFVFWRAGSVAYILITGLEFVSDFANTAIWIGDMVDIGHGIRTSAYFARTANTAMVMRFRVQRGTRFVIVGHSAGALTANLMGAIRAGDGLANETEVVTFAGPHPFNQRGLDLLNTCTNRQYAILGDPVVYLPQSIPGVPEIPLPVARLSAYRSTNHIWLRSPYLQFDPRNHFIGSYQRSLTMPSVITYPRPDAYSDFATWRTAQMTTDEYRRWRNDRNTTPFNIGGPSTDEYRCAEAISSATSWFDLFQRLQYALGQVDNFGRTLVRIGPAPQDCRRMLERVLVQVALGDRLATQALAADFTPSISSGATGDWGHPTVSGGSWDDEPAAVVPFTGQAAMPDYMGRTLERFANMGGQAGAAIANAPRPITSDTSQIRLFHPEGTRDYVVTVGTDVVYVSQSESAATNQLGRWRQSLRNGQLTQQLADTLEFTDFPYEVVNGTIVRIQGR